MASNPTPASSDVPRTSAVLVLLAWAVVAVPALWGISMSGRAAMKLFQNNPTQTSGAAPASAPAAAK